MLKLIKAHSTRGVCLLLCLAVIISVPFLFPKTGRVIGDDADTVVLNIWQIDSFEGGKGSRSDYLQRIADGKDYYVNVISLSADAARENLGNGNMPDIISYGAGVYGLESYINSFTTWCHGGYCILTMSDDADFTDINANNTVINGGIDNLCDVASLFCGVGGAFCDRPTGAYTKLLNGKFKYMLGTQRDIFRLRTRGVPYKIKAVTQFNDLYQNISVVTKERQKAKHAEQFIEDLKNNANNLNRIGLMCDNLKLYDDGMEGLEGVSYEFKLNSPVSETLHNEIKKATTNGDLNLLKKLLK